jgi:hypothetical protein
MCKAEIGCTSSLIVFREFKAIKNGCIKDNNQRLMMLISGIVLAVTFERLLALFCDMPTDKNEINFDIELDKLAKRLKSLRIAKGYTSYEVFAFENNINRVQYGRYENGNDLRYTSLLKVIKALDMTPAEFFSEGFE